MYTAQVSSKLIGCSELNRDGYGVNPEHCHALVDKFLEMGFVPSTGRFMAVEVPVSNEGDKTRQFNEQLVAESHDLFLGCFTWEDRFPFYFNK